MNTSIRDEFIGSSVEIVKSSNRQLVGLKGKIIDETKNTFMIKSEGKEPRTILKKGSTFKINESLIEGSDILRRAEERIKLKEN